MSSDIVSTLGTIIFPFLAFLYIFIDSRKHSGSCRTLGNLLSGFLLLLVIFVIIEDLGFYG